MVKFTIFTALSASLLSLQVAAYSGTATKYYPPSPVACGAGSSDTAAGVALPEAMFDSKYCNEAITITSANGEKTTGVVFDKCSTCGPLDIDVTSYLFEAVGGSSSGSVSVNWDFA